MIYFIYSESGHVKIGYSKNDVNIRLIQLQTGSPVKLSILKILNWPRSQEKLLLNKFAKDRFNNDWFLYSEDIKHYIENPYLLSHSDSEKRSRQIKWQWEKISQGLCASCGINAISNKSTSRCDYCLKKARDRHKLNCGMVEK